MTVRDRRLVGPGSSWLIGILVRAFPESRDATNRGRFAGLPQGYVQSGTPWNEWTDVVLWADQEGRLQLLVDALLDELKSQKRKIFDELAIWNGSTGVYDIAQAAPQILRWLGMIRSSPDVTLVEDQIHELSKDLAGLILALSDPRAPEAGFAGIADSQRTAQRATVAARRASASVDGLLLAVRRATTLLDDESSGTDRDRTDQLINQGVLMKHLLDQRVDVDTAVSRLLDSLMAAFPTALDVTVDAPPG